MKKKKNKNESTKNVRTYEREGIVVRVRTANYFLPRLSSSGLCRAILRIFHTPPSALRPFGSHRFLPLAFPSHPDRVPARLWPRFFYFSRFQSAQTGFKIPRAEKSKCLLSLFRFYLAYRLSFLLPPPFSLLSSCSSLSSFSSSSSSASSTKHTAGRCKSSLVASNQLFVPVHHFVLSVPLSPITCAPSSSTSSCFARDMRIK